MVGGSHCCHPWLSFSGDDALMPFPLIAVAAAAAAGMATGYVIDHVIGDSKYTAEEAVLDATLGVAGGSLIRPTLRIGQRLNTSVRISRGRPTVFERLAFRAKTERVFTHNREAAMWAMYRTGASSSSDLKRIGKFYGVSGGHSYYLAARSRGSGSPPSASPTRTKTRPDTKGAREFLRGKGRTRPNRPGGKGWKKSPGTRKSSKPGGKGRYGKQRCPPGHYWSKRYKKCIRYRKY